MNGKIRDLGYYTISELPAMFASARTFMTYADTIKEYTNSDTWSALGSIAAGSLAFFAVKGISYGILHARDYGRGTRNFDKDLRGMGKSLLEAQILIELPLRFGIHMGMALSGVASPGNAAFLANFIVSPFANGFRWYKDWKRGLIEEQKVNLEKD